jgi:c-di-GMP-binding flagellar brake protein YcgR
MKSNFGTVNFERRQHPRFSVNLPVEYRKNENSKGRPANTGDLSEGGLLLYVSETVEIGQELILKMYFTSDRNLTAISARTQVVWKDIRLENNGPRRIGVKFVDISAEDLKSLKDFINNLLALKTVHEPDISNRSFSKYQVEGIIEKNS